MALAIEVLALAPTSPEVIACTAEGLDADFGLAAGVVCAAEHAISERLENLWEFAGYGISGGLNMVDTQSSLRFLNS